jgi:hypothetical protein
MMNCSEAKELIQLYMDNELDARNTLGVQHHLEACPSCRSLLDYFIKQDQTLQAFAKSQGQGNNALREAILQAIHNAPLNAPAEPVKARGSVVKSWLRSPALRRIAAVLVVAMAIAFFLLRGSVSEKVYADVILDHEHHCTLDRLTRAISDPEQIDKLCAEYGRLDKVPDLSAFGFSNVRAKICPLNKVKFLHLIYQSETQKPLSVFFRLHDDKEVISDDLMILKKQGYEIASVSNAGIDWVVISMLDESQTAAITRHLSENL